MTLHEGQMGNPAGPVDLFVSTPADEINIYSHSIFSTCPFVIFFVFKKKVIVPDSRYQVMKPRLQGKTTQTVINKEPNTADEEEERLDLLVYLCNLKQ